MGIPVLGGRSFTESDTDGARRVAVIDQFLARKYWPNGRAIGSGIKRGLDDDDPVWTIVGVVSSVKTANLAEQNPVGHVYVPYPQDVRRTMHLVVKTNRDIPQVTAVIRRQILGADP